MDKCRQQSNRTPRRTRKQMVESCFAQVEAYNRIMESAAQAERGELLDGPTAMQALKQKYAR